MQHLSEINYLEFKLSERFLLSRCMRSHLLLHYLTLAKKVSLKLFFTLFVLTLSKKLEEFLITIS